MTDFVRWGIIIGGLLIGGGVIFYLANQRSCMDGKKVSMITIASIGIGTIIFIITVGPLIGSWGVTDPFTHPDTLGFPDHIPSISDSSIIVAQDNSTVRCVGITNNLNRTLNLHIKYIIHPPHGGCLLTEDDFNDPPIEWDIKLTPYQSTGLYCHGDCSAPVFSRVRILDKDTNNVVFQGEF